MLNDEKKSIICRSVTSLSDRIAKEIKEHKIEEWYNVFSKLGWSKKKSEYGEYLRIHRVLMDITKNECNSDISEICSAFGDGIGLWASETEKWKTFLKIGKKYQENLDYIKSLKKAYDLVCRDHTREPMSSR